jgi:hypothetical protein
MLFTLPQCCSILFPFIFVTRLLPYGAPQLAWSSFKECPLRIMHSFESSPASWRSIGRVGG